MSERKAKHDLGSGFWKCPACQPTGPANRFDCRVCGATGMVSSESYDAFEAMVDVMHPGVGENDTLGAPYCFDRGLLREFAARLLAAGFARHMSPLETSMIGSATRACAAYLFGRDSGNVAVCFNVKRAAVSPVTSGASSPARGCLTHWALRSSLSYPSLPGRAL